jgi:hypothetical protein
MWTIVYAVDRTPVLGKPTVVIPVHESEELKPQDNGTHRIRVEEEEAVRSLPAQNSRWNSLMGGRRAGFSGCSLLDLTGSLYS